MIFLPVQLHTEPKLLSVREGTKQPPVYTAAACSDFIIALSGLSAEAPDVLLLFPHGLRLQRCFITTGDCRIWGKTQYSPKFTLQCSASSIRFFYKVLGLSYTDSKRSHAQSAEASQTRCPFSITDMLWLMKHSDIQASSGPWWPWGGGCHQQSRPPAPGCGSHSAENR